MEIVENEFDVAILGGGPAGLAAFDRLKHSSSLRVVLIDSGRELSERTTDTDYSTGIGGAGLYSDGKFSFFPSSTALWKLENRTLLKECFDWTNDLLIQTKEIPSQSFPSTTLQKDHPLDEWSLKPYPSFYLSLEARMQLITQLSSISDPQQVQILTNTDILSCDHSPITKMFTIKLNKSKRHLTHITAKSVIYALGRFGPLSLSLNVPYCFYRVEIGVRIEDDSSSSFFKDNTLLDPKYRFTSSASDSIPREWRTFCACRNGEVVFGNTVGHYTYSGRGDGPPSGKHNIGFNLRLLAPPSASALTSLWQQIRSPQTNFQVNFQRILLGDESASQRIENAFGKEWTDLLLEGLSLLANEFPVLKNSPTATLIGPTVEGVGWYPQTSQDLKIEGEVPLWVAGDSTGRFRGITAALISGRFVASQLLSSLDSQLPLN